MHSSIPSHPSQPRSERRSSIYGACVAALRILALVLVVAPLPNHRATAQAPVGPGGAPGGPSIPIFGGSPIPDDKPPASRTVQGRVLNNDDVGLPIAMVYIRDLNTNRVLSLFTDDTGSFSYGQLDRKVDYHIWAEYKGKKSPEKLLSSLDAKDILTIRLRIDTKK